MLIRLGLAIYTITLFTSFLHVWEVYSRFGDQFPVLDRVWVALGVALGIDLAALYYSYLSVIGVRSAKIASYLAVSLVWFTVLVSLLSNAHTPTEKAVAIVLSSFVLVTTFFMGKVLGELSDSSNHEQEPDAAEHQESWIPTKQAAEMLGLSRQAFLTKAKRLGLASRQHNRSLLWRKEDVEDLYAQLYRGESDNSPSSP
jgi:hypothetical protein